MDAFRVSLADRAARGSVAVTMAEEDLYGAAVGPALRGAENGSETLSRAAAGG